ncbi:hypothetical protein C8F04DRAFT_1064471 [Mycena alexandri]|uniref:Uncharacterized protein n=1 Tax=Mycena alexandri TaxID=1745969 RepID=A0AAD6XIQ5_9AGAR|nr:hypothetical protein C8F04DRAFT_1064471 [Mycena alexandri]
MRPRNSRNSFSKAWDVGVLSAVERLIAVICLLWACEAVWMIYLNQTLQSSWPPGEMASRLTTIGVYYLIGVLRNRASGDCRFDPCGGHLFCPFHTSW